LEALEEIIEEANGQPVLCSYAYRSDAERIMKKFHELDPINLTECKSESALNDAMRRWKSGECRLMIGHPASMGHGIDGLQDRGHTIVWYGRNWSLDLYDQMNARLHRQGQGEPVICHRILCTDTMDEAQDMQPRQAVGRVVTEQLVNRYAAAESDEIQEEGGVP
jgi:SNF2 family DNA or RNA helicase